MSNQQMAAFYTFQGSPLGNIFLSKLPYVVVVFVGHTSDSEGLGIFLNRHIVLITPSDSISSYHKASEERWSGFPMRRPHYTCYRCICANVFKGFSSRSPSGSRGSVYNPRNPLGSFKAGTSVWWSWEDGVRLQRTLGQRRERRNS